MRYKVVEGNYKKFGVTVEEDGIVFTFEGEKEDPCFLLLYDSQFQVILRIEMPKEYCKGSVRSVKLKGLPAGKLRYNYEINGKIQLDDYCDKIYGREKWNHTERKNQKFLVNGGCENQAFDWGKDTAPEIPKKEMVLYKLHVRGFSMDGGAVGRKKGTICAVTEKIPYLKDLGITTVEIMPVYEFEEILYQTKSALPDYLSWSTKEDDMIKPDTMEEVTGLNYWGYTNGNYFAVKASYCEDKNNRAAEFKNLVKKLHQEKMECIMEIYFGQEVNQNMVIDILHYWVDQFHVDGFHLIGTGVPIMAIVQDPFLSRTKIFSDRLDDAIAIKKSHYRNLFLYNDEYLYPARKILNHQGGNLEEFTNQQKKQNEQKGFVNYIANTNGFTLMDVFSYDEKHNEQNGENNNDGNNWNYSNNCGFEGRTTRKYVNRLRERQICNALVMLFLAQGVPLLLSGDERGNSQMGNNNAYCQDNAVGWLNWRKTQKNEWMISLVRELSKFRKQHPIIASDAPMHLNDYLHNGFPDLSYHGENAWVTGISSEQKSVGMLYCGAYETRSDGTADDFIYAGYNFQYGLSTLALPKLPENKEWYVVADTFRERNPFFETEKKIENQRQIEIKSQSIVILIGK